MANRKHTLETQINRQVQFMEIAATYPKQVKLAEVLGCTPAMVTQILSGKKAISDKMWEKIVALTDNKDGE